MLEPCKTCKHFGKLSPGFAGICWLKQRGREWNEAMAITGDDDTCDDHLPIRLTDATPMFSQPQPTT